MQDWQNLIRASKEVVFGKKVLPTDESGEKAVYYFKLTFEDTLGKVSTDAEGKCSRAADIATAVQGWYNGFMDAIVETYDSYQLGKYLVLDMVRNPTNENQCTS